jgi:hypothetical protein
VWYFCDCEIKKTFNFDFLLFLRYIFEKNQHSTITTNTTKKGTTRAMMQITNYSDRVRRAFTLHDKIEALDKLQRGDGLRPLARIMKVNKSLLARRRANARSIRALAAKRGIVTTTRHHMCGSGWKSTISPEVEADLLQWFAIKRVF